MSIGDFPAAAVEPRATAAAPAPLRAVPGFEPAAIDAVEIGRVFRSRTALDGVSLRVGRGEIHALLGPNGAGKTTLLRIVAGLTAPTSGRLSVLGRDLAGRSRELRTLVGVVPAGSRSFYQRISGLENLVFFARLHGVRRRPAERRAIELLERVGLADAGRVRVGEYSQGMQKRLAIARALLPRPSVLLVDEATHDLDPVGAQAIRALIDEVRVEGATIVWATQRVDEIQGFAGRVTVLQSGRVRFGGTVNELVAEGRAATYLTELRFPGELPLPLGELEAALDGVAAVVPAPDFGAGVYKLTPGEPTGIGAALGRLLALGVDVVSCQHERAGVERAFLVVTGHST